MRRIDFYSPMPGCIADNPEARARFREAVDTCIKHKTESGLTNKEAYAELAASMRCAILKEKEGYAKQRGQAIPTATRFGAAGLRKLYAHPDQANRWHVWALNKELGSVLGNEHNYLSYIETGMTGCEIDDENERKWEEKNELRARRKACQAAYHIMLCQDREEALHMLKAVLGQTMGLHISSDSDEEKRAYNKSLGVIRDYIYTEQEVGFW